jgi:phosphoglycolate phosphatase
MSQTICPRLLLFDLDGTLIETSGEIADAVNDTLRLCELPEVTRAQVNAWIGHGTQALLVTVLAQAWQVPEAEVREHTLWPRLQQIFAACYLQRCGTRSHLYPYVREVLTELRAHGVALALVTNKEDLYTQAILEAHALRPFFDACISGDTLPRRKPDPAGVMHCLAQFKVHVDEALFVGDSAIDAQTAHNAGVRVWLLPYGYNRGQSLEASRPDRIIGDVRELLTLLPRPLG